MSEAKLLNLFNTGCTINSSGTTGTPKEIFRTPDNLKWCADAAVDSQEISSSSKIYTVCKMSHAGGLLAQTLPGLRIGASVDIEPFNPYTYFKNLINKKYTHSHLTPGHCKALMQTHSWDTVDLSGIWITCGADPVTWDIIEGFVSKGATFMSNWGMSEIGPCAINTVFRSQEDINLFKNNQGTILGNRFYCDWKIENQQLYVKGNQCIYNDWFDTADLVVNLQDCLYYTGRINLLQQT